MCSIQNLSQPLAAVRLAAVRRAVKAKAAAEQTLAAKIKADKEDAAALDTAQVLFQTALIESGYEIADPSALVSRVYRLMSKELGVLSGKLWNPFSRLHVRAGCHEFWLRIVLCGIKRPDSVSLRKRLSDISDTNKIYLSQWCQPTCLARGVQDFEVSANLL